MMIGKPLHWAVAATTGVVLLGAGLGISTRMSGQEPNAAEAKNTAKSESSGPGGPIVPVGPCRCLAPWIGPMTGRRFSRG